MCGGLNDIFLKNFPDYSEVTTAAVVVPLELIELIMLNFVHSSERSVLLGSARKQNSLAGDFIHVPLILMNRLNKTDSAVFNLCKLSLILKDPIFQTILLFQKKIQTQVS